MRYADVAQRQSNSMVGRIVSCLPHRKPCGKTRITVNIRKTDKTVASARGGLPERLTRGAVFAEGGGYAQDTV